MENIFYSGVAAKLFFNQKKANKKGIIICPRFPQKPAGSELIGSLVDKGYTAILPDYIGTYASSGLASLEEMINTIKYSVDFFSSPDIKDNYNVLIDEILLLGISFGGSISLLVGSEENKIKKIISLCPITNFRQHSKDPKIPELDYSNLYELIAKNYADSIKIRSREEWTNVCNGNSILNPVDYVEKLKDKEILLIHGKLDEEVNYKRTVDFFEMLKKEKPYGNFSLNLIENADHSENLDKQSINPILNWISKLFMNKF